MLEVLRADFARIPELLTVPAPDQPEPPLEVPEVDPEELVLEARAQADDAPGPEPEGAVAADQLGLF